jgi:hypothetical protein
VYRRNASSHHPINPSETHIINQAKRDLPDPEAHSFYRIKMPVTWQGRNYWVRFNKTNFESMQKWVFERIEKHPGAFRYPKGLLD